MYANLPKYLFPKSFVYGEQMAKSIEFIGGEKLGKCPTQNWASHINGIVYVKHFSNWKHEIWNFIVSS